MLHKMFEKIAAARSVVLSTHRHCDGDGLGAELAVFHALRKMGKAVRILNVDQAPAKYAFLETHKWVDVFVPGSTALEATDLALIMDTNDGRLVEPLFSELKLRAREVCFIDHHPVLAHGPGPTAGSLIDVSAASTGELCYHLIKRLGVELDSQIARALYTALVFDTQLFRFVKGDPSSHLMAAELLQHERQPEEIHRHLFANYTAEKMTLLLRALSRVEYLLGDRIAFVPMRAADFTSETTASTGAGLDRDDSGDVIDQIMNVGSVEVAALLREDGPDTFKLSLRSRGTIEVLSLAERFGGGGHRFASGAHLTGKFEDLRTQILQALEKSVPAKRPRPPECQTPVSAKSSGQKDRGKNASDCDRLVCLCNEVSSSTIETAIVGGADTLNKIFDATTAGVGACGGSCRRKLQPMLEHYLETGTFPEPIPGNNPKQNQRKRR